MEAERHLRNERRSPNLASTLLDAGSEIVTIWEELVREQIPSAEEQSSQILKNSLPNFISGIAEVLASNGETSARTEKICQEHGEQRAEKTYYSTEQIVHEYRLLRDVIFEVMEKRAALDSRARHLIDANIDQGIAEAVTAFIRRMSEERVHTERELFESEERYNLALRAGKIGVWEMNLKEPRILCTERQFQIFDVEPTDGQISYDLFQERIHPDDRLSVATELALAVKERRDFLLEHRVIWRDGTIHWVKASGRPYYDLDDNPDRMLGTSIDITSNKNEQNQRHELIDSLTREQEIRERFVSALTHDLRTPLTAAKMSGQLVARVSSRPDEVVRLAAKMVDNLNRADEMISDLLDSSRIRAGLPLSLAIQECEVQELLASTLEELTIIHGNRFVLESEGEIRGRWDAKGIRRIVENLCNNAVKYGASFTPIYVKYFKDRDSLCFSVKNSGQTLSAEEKKSLFNLFARSKSARILGGKGWGIGLTVVKGIAESHGGTVEVESADGFTTFTVCLPFH